MDTPPLHFWEDGGVLREDSYGADSPQVLINVRADYVIAGESKTLEKLEAKS